MLDVRGCHGFAAKGYHPAERNGTRVTPVPSLSLGSLRGFILRHFSLAVVLLFASALIVRLFLLFLVEAVYPEIYALSIIGYIAANMANPNWSLDFAYPPLIYIIYRLLFDLTQNVILVRLPAVLGDLAGGYVLLLVSGRFLSRGRALFVAFAYLFNPMLISLTVTGGFDSLVILVMLLGVWFAFEKRGWRAAIFSAVAFNLKWFPILLTPSFLKRFRDEGRVLRVLSWIVLPVVILLVSVLSLPLVSGITLRQVTGITTGYYQSRGASAFSIWLAFSLTGIRVDSAVLTYASYVLQAVVFLFVGFKVGLKLELDLVKLNLLLLYPIVNLSIQVYPYYYLWYYPFLLILIFQGTRGRRLLTLVALMVVTYAFPNIYIIAANWPRFSDQAWPLPGDSLADLILFFGAHIATWLLLFLLLKWTRREGTVSSDVSHVAEQA